jgi:predicted ATP-dependent serine protease
MEKSPDWKFNSKQFEKISIKFMSKVSHWYNVQKIQKTLKRITRICKNLQFVMIDSVQVAHCRNNGSAPYGKFQHSNQCQAVLKMRHRYPPAINLSI